MDTHPYSVYARLGEGDRIEAIDSDAFLKSIEGWTKIAEGYGDRFHHAQWHYIPGSPQDDRGVCLYKLVDGQIVPRTQEEMDDDWEAIKVATAEQLFIRTESGDVGYLTTPEEMEANPLTATAKRDVRVGTVAVTAAGIVTGEKNFPSYETSTGKALIRPGEEMQVALPADDKYDYTEFQAIICKFNTTVDDSVSAEKVAISDIVYGVNSTASMSSITKDNATGCIKLGITNTGNYSVVIRYYTHKVVI